MMAFLIALPLVFAAPALYADDTVVFIHDTHLHGKFENPGIFTKPDRPDTTIARYFGLVEQIRRRRGGDSYTRMLGGGDDPLKHLLGWEYKGDHMIDAFNAGGVDYNSFGNHEFDAAPANIRRLVQRSNFTWVTANVLNHANSDVFAETEGARRFVLEKINGVIVGFTGFAHDTAPEITIMGHRVGQLQQVDVTDPVTALNNVVPTMKSEGAELIVVLSHASPPLHRRVARNVNGIDLIVGDHAGSETARCQRVTGTPDCIPEYINGTTIALVEDDLEFLAESRFTVNDSGTVIDTRIIRHDLVDNVDAVTGDTITPSPAVQTVQDTYLDPFYDKYQDTVGRTAVPFDARGATMMTGESAAGDFLADASRAEFGSDLSLHIPLPMGLTGGTTPLTGDIAHLDVYRVFSVAKISDQRDVFFPPADLLVNMEMTGDSIAQLMEFALSTKPSSGNNFFFPITSGMWFAYDESQPVGNRVNHVFIDGKPLEDTRTYELTTSSFLAKPKAAATEAGLDPSILPPAVLDTVGSAKILNTRLITKQEVLVDKIQRESPIRPTVAGRVSVVSETQPPAFGTMLGLDNADLGRGAPEAAPPFELGVQVDTGTGGVPTFSVFALGPTHPVVSGIAAPDTNFQIAVDVTPDSPVNPDSITLTLDVSGADTTGFNSFQPAVYEPDTGWVRIDASRIVNRDGARIAFHPPHFSSFAVVSSSGTSSGGGNGDGGSDDTCLVERMRLPTPLSTTLRSARDRILRTTIGRWLTATYYRLSRRVP